MSQSSWTHCDVSFRWMESRGSVAWYIACAIHHTLPHDMAITNLRSYLVKANPEFLPQDFELRHRAFNHTATAYPDEKDILFITPFGVTKGPPRRSGKK
jgi:hypothetical protein